MRKSDFALFFVLVFSPFFSLFTCTPLVLPFAKCLEAGCSLTLLFFRGFGWMILHHKVGSIVLDTLLAFIPPTKHPASQSDWKLHAASLCPFLGGGWDLISFCFDIASKVVALGPLACLSLGYASL